MQDTDDEIRIKLEATALLAKRRVLTKEEWLIRQKARTAWYQANYQADCLTRQSRRRPTGEGLRDTYSEQSDTD